MSRSVQFGDLVSHKGEKAEVVGLFTSGGKPEQATLQLESGDQFTVPADELAHFEGWELPISGRQYSPWRIALAQQGSGIALLVDRGIACEGHVHCLTKHTQNHVSYWTAEKAVEKVGRELGKQIDAFCEFQRSLPFNNRAAEALKDSVGVLFMQYLLEVIVGECERCSAPEVN